MSTLAIACVLLALLLVLLFGGLWIALALVGFFGNWALSGFSAALAIVGTTPLGFMSRYHFWSLPPYCMPTSTRRDPG